MPLLPNTLPLENLLIKVVDVVANCIGAVGSPLISNWAKVSGSKAEMKALRIRARGIIQLKAEIREIREGRKAVTEDFKLIEIFRSEAEQADHELAQTKEDLLGYLQASGINVQNLVEVERQLNLLQIGIQAIEQSSEEGDATKENKPIDDDWMAQWRNRAQDVSNQDMQQLWAKVLKEETKSAGQFSIHTLDLLSRMSRKDAELIERLGPFVLNNAFVSASASDFITDDRLTIDELLFLQDLKILNSVGALHGTIQTYIGRRQTNQAQHIFILTNYDKCLLFVPKNENPERLAFASYPLTRIGREILSLASCKGDSDYLRIVANEGRAQNIKEIFVCDLVKSGDTLSWSNGETIWKSDQ
ncbi:DUF2806 domain-containing protein [Hyphomicrobium sp.]|uniref:DUF2806 domain-containing protein n=1 Tax=Hyphomicrobium sp. TaxID=82 RepID=UPI001D2FD26D|nr:DUF2806 domain-containing protein [Hyphomicrobium sp.]MBY0562470.1 DUF2806 domain-containing protein [Hyphomicrobium sp.]